MRRKSPSRVSPRMNTNGGWTKAASTAASSTASGVSWRSSVSNLFFRYPELEPRRRPPKDTAELQRRYWESCRTIRRPRRSKSRPMSCPSIFGSRMTVTAAAGLLPPARSFARGCRFLGRIRTRPASNCCPPCRPPRALTGRKPDSLPLSGTSRRTQPPGRIQDRIRVYPLRRLVRHPTRGEPDCTDAEGPALREFLARGRTSCSRRKCANFPARSSAARRTPAGRRRDSRLDRRPDQVQLFHRILDHPQPQRLLPPQGLRRLRPGGCCSSRSAGSTAFPPAGNPAGTRFPASKTFMTGRQSTFLPYGWVPVDPYMGNSPCVTHIAFARINAANSAISILAVLDQYRMAANSDHCRTLTPASILADTRRFPARRTRMRQP